MIKKRERELDKDTDAKPMETLHSSLQPIWLERVKSELLRPKLALETEGTE